jgi:thiamine pyrophosphate-dependent acetolactate synthase large subunit-like protein
MSWAELSECSVDTGDASWLTPMIELAVRAASEWAQRAKFVAEWRHEIRDAAYSRRYAQAYLQGNLDALPPDSIVVSDTGHAGIWTARFIELRYATQRYYRGGFARLGLPGGAGVKSKSRQAGGVFYRRWQFLLSHRRAGSRAPSQHQRGDCG